METFEKVMQYGWPTVALVFLCVALWKGGVAIFKRLFDDKTGLITIWVAENQATQAKLRDYMDQENKRAEEHLGVCGEHVRGLTKTSADIHSLKSAALEGCHMCREWSNAFPDHRDKLLVHISAMEHHIQASS